MSGQVSRKLGKGVVLYGRMDAPGESWRGEFVFLGWPEEAQLADGDKVRDVLGYRVENFQDGTSTLRVYKFLRKTR